MTDNHHLRAIILKLQDRLSDDDRRRLHFFLGDEVPRRIRDDPSPNGTLCLIESLFDQDKINEQDVTFLLNAFNEIQCVDAANVLREHMTRMQINQSNNSTYKSVQFEEEDKLAYPSGLLVEKQHVSVCNTLLTEKSSSLDDFSTITSGNGIKTSALSEENDLCQGKCSFVFIILIILLVITLISLIIGIIVLKFELRKKDDQIRFLKDRLRLLKQPHNGTTITLGTKCGCSRWCTEHGSSYGVCGDGHTCICRDEIITKESIGNACTCDEWCRERLFQNGGICGDGYTCICSE